MNAVITNDKVNEKFEVAKQLLQTSERMKVQQQKSSGNVNEVDVLAEFSQNEGLKILKELTKENSKLCPPLSEALLLLGEFYGKGLYGLNASQTRAFSYYLRASLQNDSEGAFRVAACYELGSGVKKNCIKAYQNYKKAAMQGHSLAMHKVALSLLYGELRQKVNLKSGLNWLKRAAQRATKEHPEALHDLAQCFEEDGGCPILPPDEQYAFYLYSKGGQFGFAPSQFRIGACYEYGILGCDADVELSLLWYGKAAAQGYHEAELAIASFYLYGCRNILDQNKIISLKWVRKAAEASYPKAIYTLGRYYEDGIGVEPNETEALRLFQQASALGNIKASDKVKSFKRRQKSEKLKSLFTIFRS